MQKNIGTLFSASTRSANRQPPSLMEAKKNDTCDYLQKQKRQIHSVFVHGLKMLNIINSVFVCITLNYSTSQTLTLITKSYTQILFPLILNFCVQNLTLKYINIFIFYLLINTLNSNH